METLTTEETVDEGRVPGEYPGEEKVVVTVQTLSELMAAAKGEVPGVSAFIAGLDVKIPRKINEANINWWITVDRLVVPQSCPKDARIALFKDQEMTGPQYYHVLDVKQWRHGIQESGGRVDGQTLYAALTETGEIKNCMGLRDAEEMQKMGVEIFEGEIFGGKELYFWRGARRGLFEDIIVPFLKPVNGEIILRWSSLWCDFGPKCVALQFPEKDSELTV